MSCREDKPVRYEGAPTPVDVPASRLPHLDLHSPGLGPVLCADSTANSGYSVEEFLCRLATAVPDVVTGPGARADPASAPGEAREAGTEAGQEEEGGRSHRLHVLLATGLDHNWAQLSRLGRIYTSS